MREPEPSGRLSVPEPPARGGQRGRHRPELLSPAGDWERLEMALHYGADAVYLAGTEYGLRAAAGNFRSPEELRAAVRLAHAAGAKVYVAVNALPREAQLPGLPAFLEQAAAAGADAFILSDLGVLDLARRCAPEVALHVSTQLGVVNSAAATMLAKLGASRVILARELSLEEIREIRRNTPPELELEAFVHGAMCVSFSGRCLLSNYLTGRDGNGGACAQPCRWKYHLVEERRPGAYFELTEDGGSYILNANDLCMIAHLEELAAAGIDSFKIEGRMKSAYYAAAVTNAYRHALDDMLAGRPFDPLWLEECGKISHRDYCTGFYYGAPGENPGDASYHAAASICAVVESCDGTGEALLTERNRFSLGDTVELLRREGKPLRFVVSDLRDGDGAPIDCARHPMMPLRMRLPVPAPRLSILRTLTT